VCVCVPQPDRGHKSCWLSGATDPFHTSWRCQSRREEHCALKEVKKLSMHNKSVCCVSVCKCSKIS